MLLCILEQSFFTVVPSLILSVSLIISINTCEYVLLINNEEDNVHTLREDHYLALRFVCLPLSCCISPEGI